MVGGSTAFYVAYLAEQRKHPDEPILPTLRLMSGGGAPKPPEIHFEVRDEIGGRGVVHGYGMTEVPMIANGSPHDSDEQLANTDGRPVEGAEVRIVRLDGSSGGTGEEGEIRVRGPMVCHGYTDPALAEEAFDDQGYFRTGDLGRLRADGHLVITGRLKDVIVRKGRERERHRGGGRPLPAPQGGRGGGHRPARPRAGRAGVRGGPAGRRRRRRWTSTSWPGSAGRPGS